MLTAVRCGSLAAGAAAVLVSGCALASGCGPVAHHGATRAVAPPAAEAPAVVTAPPVTAAPPTSVAAAVAPAPPTTSAPAPSTTTSTVPAPPSVAPGVESAVHLLPHASAMPVPVGPASGLPAGVVAQASALGGTQSVALADPSTGRDLGALRSTPAGSPAAAAEQVAGVATATIATCTDTATPVALGTVTAQACTTALGPAISWSAGAWRVQALDESGTAGPEATAAALAGWMGGHHLPATSSGLVVAADAGAATATVLTWVDGSSVDSVRSTAGPAAAADLASSLAVLPG